MHHNIIEFPPIKQGAPPAGPERTRDVREPAEHPYAPAAGPHLVADQNEVKTFLNAVFPRCTSLFDKAFVLFQGLQHEPNRSILFKWHRFSKSLAEPATEAATLVANRPREEAAVFCLLPMLFGDNLSSKTGRRFAGEDNVICGPVIAVEIDHEPRQSLKALEAVIGPATLVVASGGLFQTGDRTEDKLHAYWRLKSPALDKDDLARLKRARSAAAILVDADRSAVPLCHPMRLPGSWHTKGKPRPCKIVRVEHGREIDLNTALEKLETAAGAVVVGINRDQRTANGFKTAKPWTADDLTAVARTVPNNDLPYDEWNRLLMAFYDASHGSLDGLDAAHEFSAKSEKYDPDVTDERWSHYSSSPPTMISGATLRFEMRRLDPTWTPAGEVRDDFDPSIFERPEPVEDGPVDIFGDADPGELGILPANALPPMLTRWVRSEARRKGVPEPFAAISALTVIGAAIGADIRLQVQQRDDGWTEPANLWTALVAPPGSAKSPIISEAVKPLRKMDEAWTEADIVRHAAWYAASKRKGKDAPPPQPEPPVRRAVIDDVTSEKATRIFRDNPRGVLQASDELAGVLGGLDAYKSGKGADRTHFLRSFDGDNITSDRVGSGTISAKRAQRSILAGTQPEKLKAIAHDLGSDGLLQRFIVVLHDERERRAIDEEPDREASAWFTSAIKRLTSAAEIPHQAIKLSAEAGAGMAAAGEHIRQMKHIPGASNAFKGHIEKWGKLLPRLILIMHVARALDAGGDLDQEGMVDLATVEMAVRFARLLLRHSLAFYTTYFPTAPAASEAVSIAGYLLTKPELRTVTRRNVYDARKSLRGPENVRFLLAAMGELEAAGWCTVKDSDSSGPTAWQVDQRIHERFAERAIRERRERADKQRKIVEAGKMRAWLSRDADALPIDVGGIFG